jgi:putative lipoprotein
MPFASKTISVVMMAVGAVSLSACEVMKSTPPPLRAQVSTLSGRLVFSAPPSLPSGTLAEITLSDVSRADAPAIDIAQARFAVDGRALPIVFELGYDPTQIQPERPLFYAVSARLIGPDERLLWITDRSYYLPASPGSRTRMGDLELVPVR